MSSHGFQDDSSECSSDEYEIVSHQSENDQVEEESVSGSARDGAEMDEEIVSHGSVDGGEGREDGDEHDLVEEDRDDDGFEEERDEDILEVPEQPAEDDSEEIGSTPTIVPSQSDANVEDMDFEDDDENKSDDGMLHFREIKVAGQDDVVLGVLPEHDDDAASAVVRLPMTKEKLTVTKPIRIYYGGPPSFRTRVIEKVGRALVLSNVIFDTDGLGNPERFDMFNVSPADIRNPDVELVRSANLKMEVYGPGLKQKERYDLVILVDDDIERHFRVAWNLPTILIDTRREQQPRRVTFSDSMLFRQQGDLSSVNTHIDTWHAEKMPTRHLATAVNFDFFESIDAEQLNRHIASLVERYERANSKLQKSALEAAVEVFLEDACDTVYEVGAHISYNVRDALRFCKNKITGSALSTSLPTEKRQDIVPKPRVTADSGKWLRTVVTLLGTFMLLRLSTYAIGALVINPSMAVGSYVGSNTMSYFQNQSSMSQVYNATADTIAQVQVPTTSISQPLEKTQSTSKPRSDIMPVYGAESRALTPHPAHKEQQPSKKKCPKKCRAATWTLQIDNENLILTPTSKASWGRAPCEPTLIAVDQSGYLVNTTLAKTKSNLYEVGLDSDPAKEILLVGAMLDSGYLIRGHLVAKADIPTDSLANVNVTALTAKALDWMVARHGGHRAIMMRLIDEQYKALETLLESFQAKVQGGTAALLETCNTAVSSSFPRAKVPEKDSVSKDQKDTILTKLRQYDTTAIAAAYKKQLGRVDELKASAWSKAQDIFSRSNDNPTKPTARDFVREFQHRSKSVVEKMQKDTLSAVKKASGQAKTLKDGLKKTAAEKKKPEKKLEKKVSPVPYGRRA